jgi:hypothetical protein
VHIIANCEKVLSPFGHRDIKIRVIILLHGTTKKQRIPRFFAGVRTGSTYFPSANIAKQATFLSLFILSVLQTGTYPILASREGEVDSLVTTEKRARSSSLISPFFLPDALQ